MARRQRATPPAAVASLDTGPRSLPTSTANDSDLSSGASTSSTRTAARRSSNLTSTRTASSTECCRTPLPTTTTCFSSSEAINRSYCPHHFEGAKDNLYLWIGHRLDEQPTKSFIADEYIPSYRLSIRRPEPPGALKEAFAYVPDHLLLSVAVPADSVSPRGALRIDAALFRTLWAMLHGLPRHLINPGELNRLDAFIDRLRCMAPSRLPKFLIHNTEHVTSERREDVSWPWRLPRGSPALRREKRNGQETGPLRGLRLPTPAHEARALRVGILHFADR